jgi:threonine aldolase
MVYFYLAPRAPLTPLQLAEALRRRGVLTDFDETGHFRLVTHYWVSGADVDQVVTSFREALSV